MVGMSADRRRTYHSPKILVNALVGTPLLQSNLDPTGIGTDIQTYIDEPENVGHQGVLGNEQDRPKGTSSLQCQEPISA